VVVEKELVAEIIQEEKEEPKVVVKKFSFEGKNYLKENGTNILYDVETQEELGVFNEAEQCIELYEVEEVEVDEE